MLPEVFSLVNNAAVLTDIVAVLNSFTFHVSKSKSHFPLAIEGFRIFFLSQ